MAPGVEGAFLCHRCRVRDPTGNRDDVGVAKVLGLDARWHQPGVAVVVAECTITSTAKCPEGAGSPLHDQEMKVTTGHHEHLRPPKRLICCHQRGCQPVGFIIQAPLALFCIPPNPQLSLKSHCHSVKTPSRHQPQATVSTGDPPNAVFAPTSVGASLLASSFRPSWP